VVILIVPLFLIEITLFEDLARVENSSTINVLAYLVWTLYYGATESSTMQATFGKKICGLMVIDEAGNRLSFKKAAFRFLAQLLSIAPLGFGIWAIANDEKKQGWHDVMLGCYVIKKKSASK
jgi:uncharacterized RDD family membrane protein YckC